MQALMDWMLSAPASVRWVITLIFAALVVALSISPGLGRSGDNVFVWVIVRTPTLLQKIMHVVTYAALAMFWMWALESTESKIVQVALTIISTVGLGAAMEWYQARVAGRFGTMFDVFLNTIGTIIGIIAALLFM